VIRKREQIALVGATAVMQDEQAHRIAGRWPLAVREARHDAILHPAARAIVRFRSRLRRPALHSNQVRSLIASVVLAAALLGLVAAGCGGSSSDTKANEAYADTVCKAFGTWAQQIKDIATNFSGGISKASLESKVTQAQTATKTLVNEIKSTSPPDTSEGKAAKQQLDQLSTDITKTVDAAKSSIDQIQGNASAASITAAVTALAPQVQSLASEAKSALTTLEDAGGSLASAFKNTDSCKSLGNS
jgi:hypothetical protein